MLAQEQMEVAVELLHVLERVGAMPTTIQAILAKLIPKIKAKELTYRSIGLFPSLYRQWSRCRQEEARRWEAANRDHQRGRSIMTIVFLQALRAESGQVAHR